VVRAPDRLGFGRTELNGWHARFKRTGKRADIFLSTKFGALPDNTINGSPEHVLVAAEASLKKLGVETIDLYYLHVRFLE
jgi:aryl-alcohol dehydrogenase-like predicted oxidoreductase